MHRTVREENVGTDFLAFPNPETELYTASLYSTSSMFALDDMPLLGNFEQLSDMTIQMNGVSMKTDAVPALHKSLIFKSSRSYVSPKRQTKSNIFSEHILKAEKELNRALILFALNDKLCVKKV